MRRVIVLFTLFCLVISNDELYKCDGPKVPIDKYCYYFEYNPSPDFNEQKTKCEQMGAFLAGFDSEIEQTNLVKYIISTKKADFSPIYIGLQCVPASGDYKWSWMNPHIVYNYENAAFTSGSIHCLPDDTMTHFALTSDSQWENFSPSEQASYQPQLLVCQSFASDSNASPPWDPTTLIVCLSVACGILIILMILMMIQFRKKISALMNQLMANSRFRRGSSASEDDADVEKRTSKDGWELGRQFIDIQFSNKLGTGAFGVVYLGRIDTDRLPTGSERSLIQLSSVKLNGGNVAVKMLHESADRLAEVDFLQEIELMKTLGYHERLVNMIAAVTESQPHLLITEYCSNGDLLTYLKDRREYMLELPRDVEYAQIYKSLLITQEQQLQFSVQIAYGLEFLSGRGFVHRDIAARNILVDERNGCKIGDFGLCRRVQQEELYLSRGGRLPIKWMSPEALRRYEMSTASDVWSYGVLLFEIITLGGSPYPNWEPSEILPRLEAGERMERPDNCPDSVYEAMTLCWSRNPINRPDFTTLRCLLAKALEESPSEYYLQLDAQRDYYLVPRSKDLPVPEDEFIRII